MLQCAPYIKNICDNINSHLWAEEEITSEQSPFQKKDSKVSLTDVKGFKVTTVESDVKGSYQIGFWITRVSFVVFIEASQYLLVLDPLVGNCLSNREYQAHVSNCISVYHWLSMRKLLNQNKYEC